MISALIKKIGLQLDKAGVPYMIIGGQAVLLYGSPRLTRDIDITLGVDTDRLDAVRDVCHKVGLRPLTRNPEAFAKKTKVLPAGHGKSKIRVDFIFSFTPYEKQALDRVRKVRLEGYSVKFASPEDVVIHKMVAGRALDEEDVKNILQKHGKAMNLRYVRGWLFEFGSLSEHRGIAARFNRMVKELR